MKKKVIVLGAGLTGLRATLHLVENGVHVDILERDRQVGGMTKSHFYKGYTFDHGPHAFYSRDEWLIEEFKDLVGEGRYNFLQKWSQVHYKKKYFNHPLRLVDVVTQMSPFEVVGCFFSFLKARLRAKYRRESETNAEEFLVNQFGRVLYEEFFGPYTEKVWDVHPSQLDADFARDRVPHANLWEVIKKTIFKKEMAKITPSGRVATHDNPIFYYPKPGAYALSEGLAQKIQSGGGNIHPLVELTRIDTANKRVYFQSHKKENGLEYDFLVSTIPLSSFINLLDPPPSEKIISLVKSLKYRALLFVCLLVNKESVLGPAWIYFTNQVFNRISEYKKFSSEVVPKGTTGLCLEIACNENDNLYSAQDERIYRMVLPELEQLGLVKEKDIEDYVIFREPNAYPLYQVGYRETLRTVMDYIHSIDGLYTAGRQGTFSYINQDQAMKEGYEVAERIVIREQVEAKEAISYPEMDKAAAKY
jgi:protoporphyrinogen oxidase